MVIPLTNPNAMRQFMKVFDAQALIEISREFDREREERREIARGFREYDWYGYTTDEGFGAIRFVFSLFRGQTNRHVPMLPAIARGFKTNAGQLWERTTSDQAKIILRIAQSWWFAHELKYHPVTGHAAKQKLKLNKIGMAQHYGIPTGYLDLTDNFSVGAFFATCHETTGGWQPMSDGIGVVYRIELNGSFSNPFGQYLPLGPQPLPRPTEQCAWVTELPITHSFDGWPNVQIMKLHQDASVGEHFLEKYDGGKALFPDDPLADVAQEILKCGEIPSELVEAAIETFANDPDGIKPDQINDIRIELSRLTKSSNYRRLLSEQQIAKLTDDFEWREKMLQDIKVKWRAVADVPELSISNQTG